MEPDNSDLGSAVNNQSANTPELHPPSHHKTILLIAAIVVVMAGATFFLWRSGIAMKFLRSQEKAKTVDLEKQPEYKDGAYVLNQIKSAYDSTTTYAFSGQAESYHLEGFEESSSYTFSGIVVRPDKLSITSQTHEVVRSPNNPDEVYDLSDEIRVVDNKVFSKRASPNSESEWYVDPFVRPLINDPEYLQYYDTYKKKFERPSILVIPFAKNLMFVGQESGLLHYRITPASHTGDDLFGWINNANRLPPSYTRYELLSGDIWMDSSFQVIKETYSIGPSAEDKQRYQDKEGTRLTINYTHYNEPKSIAIPTEAADYAKGLDDLAAGKDPYQVEKELWDKALQKDASLPAKERDSIRFSDMRQLDSVIGLYFYNNNETYPNSLEAIIGDQYLQELPNPPTPNDGACTAKQNQYRYEKLSNTSYRISFCFGFIHDGYAAGVHYMTEQGITPRREGE